MSLRFWNSSYERSDDFEFDALSIFCNSFCFNSFYFIL